MWVLLQIKKFYSTKLHLILLFIEVFKPSSCFAERVQLIHSIGGKVIISTWVTRWAIFMEQKLRLGLVLSRLGWLWATFNSMGHILTTLHTPKKILLLLINSSKVSFFHAGLVVRGVGGFLETSKGPRGPPRAPKWEYEGRLELGLSGHLGQILNIFHKTQYGYI